MKSITITSELITRTLAVTLSLCLSFAFNSFADESSTPPPTPQITSPPAQSPELNTSQRERVMTAKDFSTTIDEAALYGLLENMNAWEKRTGTISGVIPPANEDRMDPNYLSIRKDPAKYRGQIFKIEGKLIRDLPVKGLKRKNWENLRAWILQVRSFDKPMKSLTYEDLAIVYLTSPPTLSTPSLNITNQPAEAGSMVTVYTRFYKIVRINNSNKENPESKDYLAFVGNTIEGDIKKEKSYLVFIMLGMVILLVIGFLRLSAYNKRKATKMNEERIERARKRIKEDVEKPAIKLPQNPSEALKVLETLEEVEDEEDNLKKMQREDDPASSLDQLDEEADKEENE